MFSVLQLFPISALGTLLSDIAKQFTMLISSKNIESAEVEGDYFIFTDKEDWVQAGCPDMQAWGPSRARGAVLVVVTFDDERSPNSLKDRINRLLNIVLFT